MGPIPHGAAASHRGHEAVIVTGAITISDATAVTIETHYRSIFTSMNFGMPLLLLLSFMLHALTGAMAIPLPKEADVTHLSTQRLPIHRVQESQQRSVIPLMGPTKQDCIILRVRRQNQALNAICNIKGTIKGNNQPHNNQIYSIKAT